MSGTELLLQDRDPRARFSFFEYGLQYYFAARVSAVGALSQVFGNIYHHAIEMMLKAHFCRSLSLEEIKKKFGHSLPRLWDSFKLAFPEGDLSRFDPLLADLDKFEGIRYPDDLLARGGMILIQWDEPAVNPEQQWQGQPLPGYSLTVRNIDRFVARLVPLISVNPRVYTTLVREKVRELVLFENPEAREWFKS